MSELSISIVKPSSISHLDDKESRTSIYSLDIHPTEQWKLATGGLDAKIRIWDIKPYVNRSLKSLDKHEFLLSTLSLHNGAVMCLRFSRDGRYLASGSDGDNVIIIWERDNSGYRGTVFGSKDVNKEPWKCVKRLTTHQSDVVDLAWSPDYAYLASCGLDNLIIIWDAETFDCVKKLNLHNGFVKGIAWDPAGKYLTSQSDDCSVIVWNTFDWTIAKQIYDGFEKSGGQTFYKRHSWSPDGSQICLVHAVDESQLQNTAMIVNRDALTEEVSLVGNKALITCSAYSPKLYSKSETDDQLLCVCAIGSQEGTLSIWQQDMSRAKFVVENVFNGPVHDICWSPDGLVLAACSGDSTVCMVLIGSQKISVGPRTHVRTCFGHTLSMKRVDAELEKHGFQRGLKKAKERQRLVESPTILKMIEDAKNTATEEPMETDEENPTLIPQEIPEPQRIQPVQVNQLQTVTTTKDGKRRIQPMSLSSPTSTKQYNQAFGNISQSSNKNVVFQLPPEPVNIPKPAAKPQLSFLIESCGKILIENADEHLRTKFTEFTFINERANIHWSDYIMSRVHLATATEKFVVAACQDSSLIFWSPMGRRFIPRLITSSPVSIIHAANDHVLSITNKGSLYLWNVVQQFCIFESIPLSPILLRQSESLKILKCRITANGLPLISLNDDKTYTIHTGLKSWVQFGEEIPFEPPTFDFIASKDIRKIPLPRKFDGQADNMLKTMLSRNQDLVDYLEIASLEEKLSISLTLKDQEMFRKYFELYGRRLGLKGEGVKSKCLEMIEFLANIQPLTPNIVEDGSKSVLGIDKRELLKEFLTFISPNTSLQRLIVSYAQNL